MQQIRNRYFRPIRSENFSSYRREKTEKSQPDRYKSLKSNPIVLISIIVFLNAFFPKTAEAENMPAAPLSFKTNSFFNELKSLNSLKKIFRSVRPIRSENFSSYRREKTEKSQLDRFTYTKLSNVSLSENTKKTQQNKKAKEENKKLSATPLKTKKRKMVKNIKSGTKKETGKATRNLANIASSCSESFENEFTIGYVQVGYNCNTLKEDLGCTDEEKEQINCPEIQCLSKHVVQRNSCKDGKLEQYYCDPKKEKLFSSRMIECPEGCDPSEFFCAPPKN